MITSPFDFTARRIFAWEWQLDAACAGLDPSLFVLKNPNTRASDPGR